MTRTRTFIDSKLYNSALFGNMSPNARILYTYMLLCCDDFGICDNSNTFKMSANLDKTNLTNNIALCDKAMQELQNNGFIFQFQTQQDITLYILLDFLEFNYNLRNYDFSRLIPTYYLKDIKKHIEEIKKGGNANIIKKLDNYYNKAAELEQKRMNRIKSKAQQQAIKQE